jgi:hypothetical protein
MLLRAGVVVLPAVHGMRRSGARTALPLVSTIGWAVAIVMMTAWTGKALESSVIFGRHVVRPQPGPDGVLGTLDDLRPLRLLPLVMIWPVSYMVADACWRRWRRREIPASPR